MFSNNEPRLELVTFTPGMVSFLLDTNQNIRGTNKQKTGRTNGQKTDGYERDMRSGSWKPMSGTPICFTPDGKVHNGFQRFTAAERYGKTLDMYVLYNFPYESVRYIDRSRTK